MTSAFETISSAMNSTKSKTAYEKPSILYIGSLLELTEGKNASQPTKDALAAGSCAGANSTSNSNRPCSL